MSPWPSTAEPWTNYPTTTEEPALAWCRTGAGAADAEGARRAGSGPPRGMEDLSRISGLPLWLDVARGTMVLAQPGGVLRGEPQSLEAAREVLLEPAAAAPEVLYWTFRDVVLPADVDVFREQGLRHSLLLLRPGRIGREYVKTHGHREALADGVGSPEAYGVLYGRAVFLLQQAIEQGGEWQEAIGLTDVRWIEAAAGDKVVVPAGYGVVVANTGQEPLLLSNLVAADSWPAYRAYDRMQGAAYYIVAWGRRPRAVPNPRYEQPLVPPLRDVPVEASELGVEPQRPLYSAVVHDPERFGWLRGRRGS